MKIRTSLLVRTGTSPERAVQIGVAFASALLTVLVLHHRLFGGILPSRMVVAFNVDQLGYLAISTNVAAGHSPGLEPYTMSGLNTYPSLYYTTVGLVARALHLTPVTAWNSVSLTLQLLSFTLLGWTVAELTRRPWTAALGPLVVFTGIGAWLIERWWMIPVNWQGSLWGPFGILFSNNGETAGLCAVVAGASCLALAWMVPEPGAALRRPALTIAGAVLLGISANFQTYSFLSGAYVVGAVVALCSILLSGSRVAAVRSIALLVAVLVLGKVLSGAVGTLGMLVLGLIPAVPGAVVLIRRHGPGVLAYPAVYALSAAPMILQTLSVQDTPFIRYRTTSNVALGVERWQTLAATAPLLLVCALVAALALRRDDRIALGAAVGAPIAWIMVSINDLWGANAEPYRFWINAHLLCLVAVMLAFGRLWGSWPRRMSPRGLVTVGTVIVVLWTSSLGDVMLRLGDPNMQETWDPGSSESQDIRTAVGDIGPDDGRLWASSCIDLGQLKVLTDAPMAYFRRGMAWPDDRAEVDRAIRASEAREVRVTDLRQAGVRWVLTRAGCDGAVPGELTLVRTSGVFQLWELPVASPEDARRS